MAVVLSQIYTRTGDAGTTALGDFTRVPKTDGRLAAFADTDETNATIGAAIALGDLPAEVVLALQGVQNDLFDVGSDLCTPIGADDARRRIDEGYVTRLEAHCDAFNADLEALRSFALPGGTPAAALLHVARTVARRAERSTWAVLLAEPDSTNPLTARYLNRLSDLLFILSRRANRSIGDVLWEPGASSRP